MTRDVARYLPTFDDAKFREAFLFATRAHEGQFRKENKPYITHPVEAAKILISLHADEDCLIAALLHDVPEDTAYTIDDIERKFGKKVAFLVEGVTKLSKVHFRNDMAQHQIASLKKLFIHTAEDPRIILIKLADRLHNMRTLEFIDKPEKRLRIARETLEIFVPVANLLGIEELKAELEELCFRFLYPDEYANLADRLQRNREKHRHTVEQTVDLVQKKLDQAGIKALVYDRQRNLYHIYKKIVVPGRRLDDIDDQITLRILVPEAEDCYKVLGILHGMFKPIPSKFKDYIAVPKVNGYQSLHTTVFGLNSTMIEFQIRTHQMHLEAEYGVTAHHFQHPAQQLQGQGRHQGTVHDQRPLWLEKILKLQKEQITNDAFLEDLKLDILEDRIFVFTPRGDPIDLPQGATCIDFAYSIHTQVGHRALKADINNQILPMTTVLRTGDIVRIITSDKPQTPNREWLYFAKTNQAKNKIREFLRHESREAKIRAGQYLLQKELDRAGMGLVKNISHKRFRSFCEQSANLGCQNANDIFIAIGEGTISAIDVFDRLYPQEKAHGKQKKFRRKATNQAVQDPAPAPLSTPKKIQVSLKILSDAFLNAKYLEVFSELNIQILRSKTSISALNGKFVARYLVIVRSFQQLSLLFEKIEHIDGVVSVQRLFLSKKVFFTIFSFLTFLFWAVHPYALYMVNKHYLHLNYSLISSLLLYGSLFMLFLMVFFLKRLTQRSFPELRETKLFWIITFVLNIFALVTFFAETYFFQLQFNSVIAFAIILLIFSYLTMEYIDHRMNDQELE